MCSGFLIIVHCFCTFAVDWVIVEILCLKQGGRFRGGRARYILKDALKYIPLFGWQLGAVSGFLFVFEMRDLAVLKATCRS